jgi:hypothetical protein
MCRRFVPCPLLLRPPRMTLFNHSQRPPLKSLLVLPLQMHNRLKFILE